MIAIDDCYRPRMPTSAEPMDVECPKCTSKKGAYCVDGLGHNFRKCHQKRHRLALKIRQDAFRRRYEKT